MYRPIYIPAGGGIATASGFSVDPITKHLKEGLVLMEDGKYQPAKAQISDLQKQGWLLYSQEDVRKIVSGYQKYIEKEVGDKGGDELNYDQTQEQQTKKAAEIKEPLQPSTVQSVEYTEVMHSIDAQMQNDVKQIEKNSNNGQAAAIKTQTMQMPVNHAAVVTSQNENGKLAAQRIERPDLIQGKKTFTLDLDNRTGAEVVELIVGDGMGLIASELELAVLPETFLVGGTWQARSLAVLANFAQNSPLVLKTMQVRTSDPEGNLFFTDFMDEVSIDIVRSVLKTPINFGITQDGTQFNESIRKLLRFRKMLSYQNGLLVRVPAGEKVTFNWYVESIDTGTIQQMQNYGK